MFNFLRYLVIMFANLVLDLFFYYYYHYYYFIPMFFEALRK